MDMRKDKKQEVYDKVGNFIYETNIHAQTPRSGFWLLGSGDQSVAEHLFHVAMIAYAMAYFEPKADKNKIVMMALFHDIGEGRTSDHNYVNQRYGRLAEPEAIKDIAASVPFGDEIAQFFTEEQERKTLEAQIVKDADNLEWISSLRAEEIKGNIKAREWIALAYKRLKTDIGKNLGKVLIKTHPDAWWFDVKDKWFINRDKKDMKWGNGKK